MLFPQWEYIVPTVGTNRSHRGNIYLLYRDLLSVDDVQSLPQGADALAL